MSSDPILSGERLHGLDALRALALLLGICVHGSLAFIPGSEGAWIVHDSATSATLSLAFYVPHMFRMLVFFLLAGFFGRSLLNRLGLAAFIRDRLTRIALPLVLFWPVTMAGIVATAILAQRLGLRTPPPPAQGGLPLAHLWFLYVLILLYAALVGFHALARRAPWLSHQSGLTDRAAAVLTGRCGPLVLAAPLALTLWFTPGWLPWFGIPTPDMSLVPNVAATTGFTSAFAFGWALRKRTTLMQRWTVDWQWHLAVALGATAASLSISGLSPASTDWTATATSAYALLYATGAWSWTHALAGVALRFAASNSGPRRYLSDASYWIYLAHLPVVMALQAVAITLDAPVLLKFVGVVVVAVAILLAAYRLAVRGTWFGRLLGDRSPRRGRRLPVSTGEGVHDQLLVDVGRRS